MSRGREQSPATVCFQFLTLTRQLRCGPVHVRLRARTHKAEFTHSSEVFVFGYKRVKSLILKLRQSFFGPNKKITESIRRRGCALLCRSLAADPSGRPLLVQGGGGLFKLFHVCVVEGSFLLSSIRLAQAARPLHRSSLTGLKHGPSHCEAPAAPLCCTS